MKTISILIVLFLTSFSLPAQWQVFDTTNSRIADNCVLSIAFDQNSLGWFGTTNGVSVFKQNAWDTIYNAEGINISDNEVNGIAITSNGAKWFATGYGLSEYTDTSWIKYTSQTGAPYTWSIVSGQMDTLWVATHGGGAARFDGINWEIFNTSNSGIARNEVFSVYSDNQGSVWFGMRGNGGTSPSAPLSKRLKNGDWQSFSLTNCTFIYHIAQTTDGTMWFGTDNGLVSYDGNQFLYYNPQSIGAGKSVYALKSSEDGSLWVGTNSGLFTVEEGIKTLFPGTAGTDVRAIAFSSGQQNCSAWIGTREKGAWKTATNCTTSIPNVQEMELFTLFPNPATNSIRISTSQPSVGKLAITDVAGKVLLNQFFSNRTELDISSLSAGIYIVTLSTAWNSVSRKFVKN